MAGQTADPDTPASRAAPDGAAAGQLGLSARLLDILVCPVSECRGRLEQRTDGSASGDRGGRLVCGRCGRRYRIEEAWPILIPEEAELPPAASA